MTTLSLLDIGLGIAMICIGLIIVLLIPGSDGYELPK